MNCSRRRCLFSLVAITISFFSICFSAFAEPQVTDSSNSVKEKLAALETSAGGKIGIAAINTGNNKQFQYRGGERFPVGCTSKVIGVAAILKNSMSDPSLLPQKVTYTKKDVDLSGWSPVTKNHLNDGMTVAELCSAAIMQSDNTAMNLLMKRVGGPEGVTAFARSMGDNTFRLNRWFPKEASSIPGDMRDTSTPVAMAKSFRHLVLGDVLASSQREQLQSWLINSVTGKSRIRAGVPAGWVVGDKTATGDYGTTNDIAVIWPPQGAPIVVAIYFTRNSKEASHREDVLAAATRIVINELSQNNV